MKFKFPVLMFVFATATSAFVSCKNETKMVEEEVVIESDTISLFDGVSFAGWKQYNSDTIGSKWTISEGAILASADGTIDNTGFGRSIITIDTFGNFELSLDYKIAKGGNSGIMYHVMEDTTYAQDYVTGPEFQLLDDEFSKTESLPHKMLASLYDMYAPSETKKINPFNEWNNVRLIYNNGHVEHWLNGEKVLEYEEGSEDYMARKAESKWKDRPDWGSFKSGHIGLQDHGDAVWFKNITIRRI